MEEQKKERFYELCAKYHGFEMALNKSGRLGYLMLEIAQVDKKGRKKKAKLSASGFMNRLQEAREICDNLLGLSVVELTLKDGTKKLYDVYSQEIPEKLITNFDLLNEENINARQRKVKIVMFFENVSVYLQQFTSLLMELQTKTFEELNAIAEEVGVENVDKFYKEIFG